jgi:1-acyl-sn-glycerol-3-phosphate acyltransferase
MNKVDSIAAIFSRRKVFVLPWSEGTRNKVDQLKTGFYIALKANVPIIPVAFNLGKKGS